MKGRNKVVAGISCEFCHGAGRRYIDIHSGFSGKRNKGAESKAERQRRWAKAQTGGMIRPAALYKVAKNCLGCHLVPQEKLVNIGGHPAGSEFCLVAWSQGEVRHNVWYSEGKSNAAANANRRRMMYLVCPGVELESALRAVGVAIKHETYAFKMARRVADLRAKIAVLAKALPEVAELARMVKFAKSTWLRLDDQKALHEVADKVAIEALGLTSRYNGVTSRRSHNRRLVPQYLVWFSASTDAQSDGRS